MILVRWHAVYFQEDDAMGRTDDDFRNAAVRISMRDEIAVYSLLCSLLVYCPTAGSFQGFAS